MSALTKKSAKNKSKKVVSRNIPKPARRASDKSERVAKGKSPKKSQSHPPAKSKRPGAVSHTAATKRGPVKAAPIPAARKAASAKPPATKALVATGKKSKKAATTTVRPKAAAVSASATRRATTLKPQKARPSSVPARAKVKTLPPATARKEADKLKKAKLHEKEALAKAKLQEKLQRDRERENARKAKEQEKLRKTKEQEAAKAAKVKEAQRREREEAKQKAVEEREAKRQAALEAREAERQRQLREKEAARKAKEEQKQREKAEKEAERELARRQKEEERAKRDAEREAYRKAKEAERERIRAAKEAQKRALEGRIAEATRNANKLGGGRSSTTRIYSPRAIPNQSGTTRRVDPNQPQAQHVPIAAPLADAVAPPTDETTEADPNATGVHGHGTDAPAAAVPAVAASSDETQRTAPPPERPLPTAESVEERYRIIEERLKEAPADFRHNYQETLDMSWIYHDSALEGVVYTFQELRAAIDNDPSAITDSSLQPVVDEVRRHKAAIDLVRELGEKKRAPITVDVIKKIYLTLHPEEGDIKTVKYRRDIPQHRLYFHEYSHPEKIQHKVRQVVDWLNGPEPKKLKSPIRVASRAHYELLRIFPFQSDSGKVARLFMNLLLLRAGHPPAIVHSTERQRYYESLRGSLPSLIQMVTESILNALISIEKLLDEHDLKNKA